MRVWQDVGVPALLVAAAGGHLEELWQLRPRLVPLSTEVTWVTTDSLQARSLLEGEQRLFAPPARPRDAQATVANFRFARHILALDDWTDVVSTGPLVAVPFLALACARGLRCHFVESLARVEEPSLSAKLLERLPGVRCYSPYRWWTRPSWLYRGSVLDGYGRAPDAAPRLDRVVVTVGTSAYGFRRLIRRLRAVLPPACDVLWQTGATNVSGLGIRARAYVRDDELLGAMAEADLVIAHAGAGSALAAMRAGIAPLLVPRRKHHTEHVDDHQTQIAAELARRGLATTCGAEQLDEQMVWLAASRRVRPVEASQFRLENRTPSLGASRARRAIA